MSQEYTGELSSLWKHQVEEIAQQLQISTEGSLLEIQNAVRSRLQSDSKARALYPDLTDAALPKLSKGSRRSSQAPNSKDSNGGHAPSRHSPRKSSVPAPSEIVETAASSRIFNTVKEAAQEVVDDLPEVASNAADQLGAISKQVAVTAEQQLVAVKNIDRRHLLRTVAVWAQKAEEQAGETARYAQTTLSDGWNVVGLSVAIELGLLLLASVPFAKELTIGPFEWWSRPWTPDTPWTITLPDLLVLWQRSTVWSLFSWLATSFVVPLIGAHLIVFPKPNLHGRRTRRSHYFLGIHPPSALSFSIIRLAVAIYANRVAPEPFFSLSQDIFHRFGDVQILTAAVALAFTTYELLAGHKE